MKTILHVADAKSIHTRRWVEQHRDQGWHVHVATFRPAVIPGVSVHTLPTCGLGRAGYLLAVPALRAFARRVRPDVVHAQYVTSYGFVCALARLHPLVLTAWGTDVLIGPRQSRLAKFLASYALSHADAVTTVAEHMNAAVVALGVRPDDVVSIPFGVDTHEFAYRPRTESRGEPARLICTRNFAPVYDIPTLITAARLVRARGVSLRVELVGDGPLRASVAAQIREAALADTVVLHGHVEHERLPAMLQEADIFVTPALSDGNNISLNEAMACGCFPIGTDIPANRQWLTHGVNGLLYSPGDADALARCIEQAVADKGLRLRAATINRETVERCAEWLVGVARMSEVYAAAIARARERR